MPLREGNSVGERELQNTGQLYEGPAGAKSSKLFIKPPFHLTVVVESWSKDHA